MSNDGFPRTDHDLLTGSDGENDYLVTKFDDGTVVIATRSTGSGDRWSAPVTVRESDPPTLRQCLIELVSEWKSTNYAAYMECGDRLAALLDEHPE